MPRNPPPDRYDTAHYLVEKGNIDVLHPHRVRNPDGTYSSVHSRSFGIGKGEVLLPTVWGGKGFIATHRPPSGALVGLLVHKDDWKILRRYKRTGKHLGIFRTIKAANEYAKRLHELHAGMEDDED